MIQALGPAILLKSPKGLKFLERVTKASKETVYDVEKGLSGTLDIAMFYA